jgi:hypothetical protein
MLFQGKGECLFKFTSIVIFLHLEVVIPNWSHGFFIFNFVMYSQVLFLYQWHGHFVTMLHVDFDLVPSTCFFSLYVEKISHLLCVTIGLGMFLEHLHFQCCNWFIQSQKHESSQEVCMRCLLGFRFICCGSSSHFGIGVVSKRIHLCSRFWWSSMEQNGMWWSVV